MNISYTELLYSQPSFLEGFARALDVGGTFDDFNYSSSETEADCVAIASDWYAVGADLHHAIAAYTAQLRERPCDGK